MRTLICADFRSFETDKLYDSILTHLIFSHPIDARQEIDGDFEVFLFIHFIKFLSDISSSEIASLAASKPPIDSTNFRTSL